MGFVPSFRPRRVVPTIVLVVACLAVAKRGDAQTVIADGPPGKASLVAPTGPVTTSTPTFTWNAVSTASYYLLRVTDRDNVNTDRWYRPNEAGCAAGTELCAATPNLVVKAGAARWQVLTWNASGYGPWSDTRSFLVEIADPTAAAPEALSPTGTIDTAHVAYEWTPVAGALTYRFSIRNNGGPVNTFWYTPSAAGCDAVAVCGVVPVLRLTNGTVDWIVQAWTTDGFGPWTEPVAVSVEIPLAIPLDRQLSAVKLIEYGWDRPTPAFVHDHIREMEQRPFDGVIMGLPDGGGNVFRPETWNPDTLASQLPILSDIQWQTFDSNFLAMYATSSMDWYDDDDWGVVLQHAEFMARAALEARCKGLMFDPEPYGPSPWNYAEQQHASEHTFREYEAVVRQRGRAFMQSLQQGYPALDLLMLSGYSYFLRAGAPRDADARERVLKDQGWGLLPAFLDGMLEQADPDMRMIDGQEQAYFAQRPEDFAWGYWEAREEARSYVSTELQQDVYLRNVEIGQSLYLDWIFGYFRTSPPDVPEGLNDDQRARFAEHHTYYAMKNADRYVWIYSEKMNWWTGDHLPPGAEDALRSAKRKFGADESLGFDVDAITHGAP
jgi:hypothetical protein